MPINIVISLITCKIFSVEEEAMWNLITSLPWSYHHTQSKPKIDGLS